MPTPEQIAELDAVIALLKAKPTLHRQTTWIRFNGFPPPQLSRDLSCGSAFCIAGAVVTRAGAQVREWSDVDWDGETGHPTSWIVTHVLDTNGLMRPISDYARELLGLSYGQAEQLFAAANTMEDIERIRDDIVNAQNWHDSDKEYNA